MLYPKLENEIIAIKLMAKQVKKYGLNSITLDIKLKETKKKQVISKSYFFKKQS